MAKAKTLAALAGLAGLAYALRNKDQGMTPEQNNTLANANRVSKMSEDSDTLARMNKEKTPGQGAVDDTNASIVNTITAPNTLNTPDADNTTANAYKSGVMGGARQKTAPKSVKNNITASKYPSGVMAAPVDPRQLEAGMSRGSRYKQPTLMKKGGVVNKMASGGMTASSRADGCATKGKTKGRFV